MLIRNNRHLLINYDPLDNRILVTNKTEEHLRGTLLIQELPHKFPIIHMSLELPPAPGLIVWNSWENKSLPGWYLKTYFESQYYSGLRFIFLEDDGDEFVEEWSVPSHFDLGVRCPDRLANLDSFGYFFEQVIDQPMKKVGDCYVDLGANMGAYTMGAMRSGYEKIVAVEPVPKLAEFLQDTFRGRVNVVDKAVWSDVGESRLWYRDEPSEPWGGDAHLSEEGEPVATTTLDDLLEGLDRVHLKMDIEGAEEEVVLATSSDTWSKVVRIDLEVHEWKCDAQKIAEHLRSQGFSVTKVYTFYVSEYVITSWECTRLIYSNKR